MRRTIAGHPSFDKQKKIAEETLQFFVPMAKSLGLMPMAEELKKGAWWYLIENKILPGNKQCMQTTGKKLGISF